MSLSASTTRRRAVVTAVAVILVAVAVTVWVGFGRVLLGWPGTIGQILSITVAPIALVLLGTAGLSLSAAIQRGHSIRPALVALVLAVVSGIGFGATVPEITAEGVRSLLAPTGEEWAVEMTIALCNPLGIVYLGTSIATLVFSRLAVRGPRVDTESGHEPGVG
ncbi:hypothetical protein [Microbacterium sp. MPKO10]|uniref:hypothetical protein n=1 Tax=Microbacterium sp. MPKO10 TaxID=2989818 RepID=UPI0022361678|nr:hypothetical protein [Microbacterium sp. MPKO10]MCW4459740.1 hypothetical protein [Microbacterium sp. MPKO10]